MSRSAAGTSRAALWPCRPPPSSPSPPSVWWSCWRTGSRPRPSCATTVVAQAVITDKTYTDRPHNGYSRTYDLYFRFRPRSPTGGPSGPEVEEYDAVPANQYTAINVGQVVTIRYNPQRPSQSTIYLGPPPTDGQMIGRGLLLFALWVGLFGGLCAVIVFLAWPDPPAPAGRLQTWRANDRRAARFPR